MSTPMRLPSISAQELHDLEQQAGYPLLSDEHAHRFRLRQIEKAPQLLEMLKTIIRAEFGRQDPVKFAAGTYWERAQRLVNEIEGTTDSSPR